jgi:RING finger protein 121
MAIDAKNVRFILFWCFFSVINLFIVKRALENPMKSSTPRLVYWWYQKVYDFSYFFGVISYFIILLCFFHIPLLFLRISEEREADWFISGLTLMFYCLYFGTLGRDFVDRLSDKFFINN